MRRTLSKTKLNALYRIFLFSVDLVRELNKLVFSSHFSLIYEYNGRLFLFSQRHLFKKAKVRIKNPARVEPLKSNAKCEGRNLQHHPERCDRIITHVLANVRAHTTIRTLRKKNISAHMCTDLCVFIKVAPELARRFIDALVLVQSRSTKSSGKTS